MNVRFLYALIWLLGLGSLQAASGQVLFRVTADRDAILIGEPVTLQFDLRAPLGTEGRIVLPDSVSHFQILQRGELQSADGIDGKQWTQALTITSFDSGRWQFPPVTAMVNGSPEYTDTLGITVGYAPFDAAAPYRDIKPIEAVAKAPVRYWPWVLAGAALLLLVLALYYFVFRKKSTPPPAPVILLSPFDQAMTDLDALKKTGFNLDGDAKPFYTRLNDIFRVYLTRQFQIQSLEKTNDEIIVQLSNYKISRESFHELAQALRMADIVKFAQFRPPENDNEHNFSTIRSAIQALNGQNVQV